MVTGTKLREWFTEKKKDANENPRIKEIKQSLGIIEVTETKKDEKDQERKKEHIQVLRKVFEEKEKKLKKLRKKRIQIILGSGWVVTNLIN